MSYNDIYRLRIWSQLHGQFVCNVLHFVQIGATLGNRADDLCVDFNTNMSTSFRGRIAGTGGSVLQHLECQRIVPYGDVPHVRLWTGTNVGAGIGTCGTGTLAEVVTMYTAGTGRRRRGRMYLYGGPSSTTSVGQWSSAQTAATQVYAAALMNRYAIAPIPAEFKLGIWSRVLAGATPPFDTDAFQDVISMSVRTTIRNQRRRQLGVGR